MRYFDIGNSLSQDECARRLREHESKRFHQYNVHELQKQGDINDIPHFLDNPNLRFKSGYGITIPENVDCDSRLRFQNEMRGPDRKQLFSRVFHAVPNFGRGTIIPNVESMLIMGHDTNVDEPCNSLAELDYDRNFLSSCMQKYVEQKGESWGNESRIGIASRDMKQVPRCHVDDVPKSSTITV